MYKPKPKIKCVSKLRKRITFGDGSLEDASPSPNAGCIIKKGATIVNNPTNKAGKTVG